MDEIVREIEEAFVAHWSLLGQWPGARLVDEDDREHVDRLNRHWSGARARGHRWLVHVDGKPVGKGWSGKH